MKLIMKVGPAMPVPADSFSTCPTCHYCIPGMVDDACRKLPMFPQFSRHFFRHSRYRFISSVVRSFPLSSANQTTNTAKCAMGSNHCVERACRCEGFSVRTDLPRMTISVTLHATFKGPGLKSSAYTRSAWLAAACSAL